MDKRTDEQIESDFQWLQSRVNELSTGKRQSLIALLDCVRENPGTYYLQRRKGPSDKRPYEYAAIFPDSERQEPCEGQSFSWDYFGNWSEFGITIFERANACEFSDQLVAWFRRAHPPTDEQAQRW